MKRYKFSNTWKNYLYIIPALGLVVGLLLVPVIYTLYISFTNWDGLNPPAWIGLNNYMKFFHDPVLITSFKNTIIWVLLILAIPMLLGLVLAVVIRNIWFSKVFKSIFYIPLAISGAATGIVWYWIYSRSGLLNSFLVTFGIIEKPVSWMINVPINTYAMILAAAWQSTGLNMILFLMGLQSIPVEVLEASKIDGASSWQTFFHMVLPLLKPVTTIVIILNIIGSFKVFDIIWVMTGGGPYRASETLALTMYKEAFAISHMGYGSAIAVVLSMIVFIIGVVYLGIVSRGK